MDDLITWLRAQLDEDERYADEYPPFQARVLREVEAKREVIGMYQAAAAFASRPDSPASGAATALADVVRLLALPYADRPGYREEWRP